MFLNSIFKKIFFVFVLSIVCISAYSNEDKKCEKGFTSKSLEDRIRSAHVAKLNTGNKGSDTNTDSSRSTLRDRTRAVARAVADTARRVTPSEESRRRASEAVRGAGQAVGEKAKGLGVATAEKVDGAIVSGVNALETGARAIADTARRVTPSEESRRRASEAVRGAGQAVGEKAKGLGMATAEKLDGAITSGVNALETGARATGRVVADTARRVTPSEESRRRASETVRGAVSNAGQRLQTSAQQAREQQDRIREESHARHEARQSQKSSDQQTPGGTQELESNLFSNNGVLSTVFAWFNSRGSSQEESIPEAEEVTEGILSRSIEELNAYDTIVPLRTLNALKRANIYIIDSLVRKNRKELLDEKDVGPRSVEFIEEALELRGLFLGMTDTEIEDFNKAEAKTKTRIFYSLDEIRSAIAELNAQSPPAEQIINMKTYDMYRKRDSKLPPMGLIVRLYKEEYGITQGLSDFLFNR